MNLKIEKLNDKQRDFWNYYYENFEKTKQLSIKEISKEFGCGISFIYNFFSVLGISGIKDLILYISFEKGQITSAICENENEIDCLENKIFNTILQSNQRNLELIRENQKTIENLIEDITKAKKRFCIGYGYSKLAALDFIGPFNKVDNSFILVNDEDYDKSKMIESVTNDDILIVFSMRGKNRQLIKSLKYLKTKTPELCIYLVTSKQNSIASLFTKNVILIDNIMKRSDAFTGGTMFSPLQTFLFFNTFTKNVLYQKIQEEANNQEKFVEEQLSWIDEKIDIDY